MHLTAIAIYRYNGIAYPLRVRSSQDARHVAALVIPAWAVAIALSVPFAVQVMTENSVCLFNYYLLGNSYSTTFAKKCFVTLGFEEETCM